MRYSAAKITKVKALIARGFSTGEIVKRTKVKPFSIAYYRKTTRAPKTPRTINQLHTLVKNFLSELEQLRA